MDHAPAQDTQQSKSSMFTHREPSNESEDKRSTDCSASPVQDDKRPIRRVCSPSRPRAWISNYYKRNFGVRLYIPQDDHSFYKPRFSHQRHFHWKDNFLPKPQHISLRERDGEKEKERHEQRESADGRSPPKLNTSRAFLPRSTSRRYKDMQFIVSQSDRNQSRERDHRRTTSKERERGRDMEPPSTVSQAAAATRDRAIQQKRREIDEMYAQECEVVGFVAKMLIAKDPSLELPIQSSLQENLRDIGKRCLEAMETFIENYDSRELSH